MGPFDQKVKDLITQEVQPTLSPRRKAELKEAMCRELEQCRKSRIHRMRAKAGLFWESTHEVSLAPLAATACVLLVVTGASLWRTLPRPEGPNQNQQVYLISQTDGSMEILPLRDGGESDLRDNTD